MSSVSLASLCFHRCLPSLVLGLALSALVDSAWGQSSVSDATLEKELTSAILPGLKQYCFDCHSGDLVEAEIDLSLIQNLQDARTHVEALLKVTHIVESRQMPPKDAPEMPDEQRERLENWLGRFLKIEAQTRAGDPGPVVLRRLSNAEYTYTLRDLTGVESLDPAAEFPVDGAAGEGFTNTGNALVMSPALVTKYLDAAKSVSEHMILLPDGIRFSRLTTRRDWTNEQLDTIREFYARFSDERGGTAVNLQGIQFDTNQGGRLAIDLYLQALLEERTRLRNQEVTLQTVASERRLQETYLRKLWQVLEQKDVAPESFLLAELQRRWRATEKSGLTELLAWIQGWQAAVWKFNAVGQIGREGGPPSWQEPVTPVSVQREFRIPLPPLSRDQTVNVAFQSRDVEQDASMGAVVWENARLERSGRPTVLLRDAVGLQKEMARRRASGLQRTVDYLKAVASGGPDIDVQSLAKEHQLDAGILETWFKILDVSTRGPVEVTGHFTNKMESGANYDFIKGWGVPETPSFNANSSDQEVRVPGIARPHSVFVHPSPTLFVAAGWQSPVTGVVQVQAEIADAHPECGNGVEYWILHRFGTDSSTLKTGRFEMGGKASLEPQSIAVRKGEVLALVVGPKDGNHACDLTQVQFRISETQGEQRVWDLASDVSDDLLSSNPQPDAFGNSDVWHFYRGALSELAQNSGPAMVVPPGSLLAAWQAEGDAEKKGEWAQQIQTLVTGAIPEVADSPDALLYRYVHALVTPKYDAELLGQVEKDGRFGEQADSQAGPSDLVVPSTSWVEFELPGELASEAELVVSGVIDGQLGRESAVQLDVVMGREPHGQLDASLPILVRDQSETQGNAAEAFEAFRQLFPVALCYTQIVPVDEVVTLRLFYREDEMLKRLMLDDAQAAEIDRLWDELFYISQEPIALTVAFEQLSEFATQDRPDIVVALEPLRQPINERGDRFRDRMRADEPTQLNAVLDFANQAWRKELSSEDRNRLQQLYERLRDSELEHEQALRLTLARILTSPAFLYRLETAPEGSNASPVSEVELANRLSYFLWSSMPDAELMELAEQGKLSDPEVLWQQTQRMMQHEKARRMAVHFACQWLGIRDFDQHDEKNENLYPDFASMRSAMYEESIRFFEDMIRHNRSVLDLLAADYTFVNGDLAKYYGFSTVSGDQWQRVEGVQQQGRGGVLGMATVLSKQSGASRTSPILRGNWVYETLLGQRLPRPPAGVPQLPDSLPEGLSARQLIEAHSSLPACAKCHERIDPLGFALENFDAVGRLRTEEVDTQTELPGGYAIEGIKGLRDYLLTQRRDDVLQQFNRKLLGYALGRSIQLSDQPLLDEMSARLGANDGRWNEAVKLIVLSPQFRQIRGRDFAAE
jgi:hypothetical protein